MLSRFVYRANFAVHLGQVVVPMEFPQRMHPTLEHENIPFYLVFSNMDSGKVSASQAENASSILVARSTTSGPGRTREYEQRHRHGVRHFSPPFATVLHQLLSRECRKLEPTTPL